jgi:ferredoxin
VKIDKNKCVGCGNCLAWCTMGVIYVDDDGRSTVNEEECVECSNCFRSLRQGKENPVLVRSLRKMLRFVHLSYDPPLDLCPTGAFAPPTLEWPRVLRAQFSDPLVVHPSTGVGGRGTEEIKTNDVTNRLKLGDVGVVVELGRPGLGTRFRDVQKVAMALAGLGVAFEPRNPVTALMTDTATGEMRPDVLGEKVLSCIIELKAPLALTPRILETLRAVAADIDTVVSVGIGTRCGTDGSLAYEPLVEEAGFTLSLNGKTSLGMGRLVP